MTTENAAKLWYVARDGKQTGPISEAEILAIAAHGYFRQTDLVWRPGMPEWRSAFAVFPPAPVAPTADATQVSQPPPPAAPAPQPVAAPRSAGPIQGPISQTSQPTTGRPTTGRPTTGRPTTGPTTGRPDGRPAPAPPYAERMGQPGGPLQSSSAFQTGASQTGASQTGATQPNDLYAGPTLGSSQPTALGLPGPGLQSALPHTPTTGRPLAPMTAAREHETDTPKPRTNRMAIAALVITLLAITGGVYVAAEPQITKSGAMEPVRRALASLSGAVTGMMTNSGGQIADIESGFDATAHWPVIKREFPDWYSERLREAAKLSAENKTPDEISKMLTERIVTLRRQNAPQALSASAPRLMAVANAFLANLKQLKQSNPQVCYNFIAQGELTPALMSQLKGAESPPPGIQVQVAAIFEAIAEGRKTPVTYEKPQKADYDALMTELGKLGWTQEDLTVFLNPKSLARTEPARVCQMVQDWFVAHIEIGDENTRQRLIGETLRPVVSG